MHEPNTKPKDSSQSKVLFFILVQELVDSGIAHHGPDTNSLNTTQGGLVYLKPESDQTSFLGNLAIMRSPTYQNSAAKCILVSYKLAFVIN